MKAIHINHVSVSARDLDESIAFYTDIFGLEPVPSPNFGFRVQWLQIGDMQLHLFERDEDAPARHHFAFEVDDFEALYTRAMDAGFVDATTFGYHLAELPNGTVQLYLRDPSGNLIEIDSPHADALPESIRADMTRVADAHPQSPENMRATLFGVPQPA